MSATAIAQSPMSNAPRPESTCCSHRDGQPRRGAILPSPPPAKDTSSSVMQIAAAMAALGLYGGANTPAEHTAETRRLGGDAKYRLRLVNALLGAAQAEALAESLPMSRDDRLAAYEQQLATVGVADSPTERLRFSRWQRLRGSRRISRVAAARPQADFASSSRWTSYPSVLSSLLASRARRSLPRRRRSAASARKRSATWRRRRGWPCR